MESTLEGFHDVINHDVINLTSYGRGQVSYKNESIWELGRRREGMVSYKNNQYGC